MATRQYWLTTIKTEWLLITSAAGMIRTSLHLRQLPIYSSSDFEILCILLVLFIVTRGLQQHHIFSHLAQYIEKEKFTSTKLILATFFLSMVVTNDVALLVIVPLTMMLHVNRKEWLVIFEALAANAGSALSPFGNPQNLFTYWFYEIPSADFVKTIAPFSLVFLILILLSSALVKVENTGML